MSFPPAHASNALFLFCFLFLALTGFAAAKPVDKGSPDGVWKEVSDSVLAPLGDPLVLVRPARCRMFQMVDAPMQRALHAAPGEFSGQALSRMQVLYVPMPDGSYQRFRIIESPVFHPSLGAKFPEIRTFIAHGLDDPLAGGRLDWTPKGFHAQIFTSGRVVYVDPHLRGDTSIYVSYHRRDRVRGPGTFTCLLPGSRRAAERAAAGGRGGSGGAGPVTGDVLRTYKIAVACTGEYAQFHGGTVVDAMAAIATTINRVVGIYEREFSVRMEIVANNDSLIFLDGTTDPYSNSDGAAMLSQNQTTVDGVIGSANYDIGHVFSTAGGGIAGLGVVCRLLSKARGVTGSAAPVGDSFNVDFVAHEIGHQFNCDHTFNGDSGSCTSANRNGPTAYEPGSGSTIMAYAGICGNDDLQLLSEPYFHSASHDQIAAYITTGVGGNCDTATATGNNPPTVDAGPDFTIPAATPLRLTAVGSDPDAGDVLTYNWEQRDLGPQNDVNAGDNGASPLFRSWTPTTSPVRYFPRLPDLLNNTTVLGEQLPTTSRTMTFRATVRDNRVGGGGYNADDMQVVVDGASGPFRVLFPNTSILLSGLQTIQWEVAGTTNPPVNAAMVNILLSTDGGLVYGTVLASNVVNDGSAPVMLPNLQSTTARILVEGSGNIFFDVSDSNFEIEYSDDLGINPPVGLASRGRQGGPFSPVCTTYSLTNSGVSSITWTGGASEAWISLSESGGILLAGDSTSVDVCVGNSATELPAGSYAGEVAFMNIISGETQERDVDLEVTPLGGSIRFSNSVTSIVENAGSAIVLIEREGDTTGSVGITYTTSNGSAVTVADYLAVTSTVSWADGEGGARMAVVGIVDDGFLEPAERFQVLLSNPTGGAQLGFPVTATVEILDDDSNDSCGGSVLIDSFPFATSQSTLDGVTSTGDPTPACISTFGNGVWYSFVAPTSGTFSIDTIGSDFDTGLGIYTGACSSLDLFACDDDGAVDLTSSLAIPVQEGVRYHVLAGGYNSQVGELLLQADFIPGSFGGMVNDLCSNAVAIASVPFTDLLDTSGATTAGDPGASCLFEFGRGIWYTFTTPTHGWLKVDTFGSGFDTGLALYTGPCTDLSELFCNDDSDFGTVSQAVVPVAAGRTYYILAGGFGSDSGILSFQADFVSGLCADLINDGGFEFGDPWEGWMQSSDTFSTPICDTIHCELGSTSGSFEGENWVDFVHPDGLLPESADVGQTVTIPAGASANLRFQLWISEVDGFKTDLLEVKVDGGVEATFQEPLFAELNYTERTVNLDAFADGLPHVILFQYTGRMIGGISRFEVDNIQLEVCLPDLDGDEIPNDFDADTDGDGIPNEWELEYGLGPLDATDAGMDDDGDRQSNLEEYIADTIPTNELSFLRLRIEPRSTPGEQPLSFDSSSKRLYFIDYTSDLIVPAWISALTNEPGDGGLKSVTVTNSDDAAMYRLGVGAQGDSATRKP